MSANFVYSYVLPDITDVLVFHLFAIDQEHSVCQSPMRECKIPNRILGIITIKMITVISLRS